jgi:hypothetical protein
LEYGGLVGVPLRGCARGSAAEDRLVKNLQPPLPGPDHVPQELRFVIKPSLHIGDLRYEMVGINDLAFCRECPVSGAGVCPPRGVALAPPPLLPPRLVQCRSCAPLLSVLGFESLVSAAGLDNNEGGCGLSWAGAPFRPDHLRPHRPRKSCRFPVFGAAGLNGENVLCGVLKPPFAEEHKKNAIAIEHKINGLNTREIDIDMHPLRLDLPQKQKRQFSLNSIPSAQYAKRTT